MQSLLALPSFAHSPTYALCNLWRSRYSVPGFGFWRELSIRCFARPMLLIASCLSNAANLHNELSRIAPQASHQLRRACEIMWRLQHGISPKTAKGPFVLCPCHCSFKTSAMPRAHPSSLILQHSSSSSITDPSSFTWLPHPSPCHEPVSHTRLVLAFNSALIFLRLFSAAPRSHPDLLRLFSAWC